jgi:hypothetical protein
MKLVPIPGSYPSGPLSRILCVARILDSCGLPELTKMQFLYHLSACQYGLPTKLKSHHDLLGVLPGRP